MQAEKKYDPEKYDYETIYNKYVREIISQLCDFFGNKIERIGASYEYSQDPENYIVGIKVCSVLYKKFRVEIIINDRVDFSIHLSGITLSDIEESEDSKGLRWKLDDEKVEVKEEMLVLLENYLRLQLPDKYLKYFGWL